MGLNGARDEAKVWTNTSLGERRRCEWKKTIDGRVHGWMDEGGGGGVGD